MVDLCAYTAGFSSIDEIHPVLPLNAAVYGAAQLGSAKTRHERFRAISEKSPGGEAFG